MERYYKDMEYREDPEKFLREQKEAEKRAKAARGETEGEDEDEMDD